MQIQIPEHEGVDKRLLKSFEKVRRGRRDFNRFKVEVRASSFPICPRKYHIYRRLAFHKRPYDQDTFIRDSASLQGTALHLALQRWFGLEVSKHAYGNWGCVKCKKIRRHKRGVQYCQKCGDEMVYLEYEIRKNKKVPFTGHIDMVLWFRDRTFLVDFKGSSLDKMEMYKRTGVKYEHYLQANAYANAINLGGQKVGKLPGIDKIVILYVDRGRPWRDWWPIQLPVSKKAYRETISLIQKSENSLKSMEVPRGICESIDEPKAHWCEAKHLCFDPLLETKLDDEIHPLDSHKQDRRLESQIVKKLKKEQI